MGKLVAHHDFSAAPDTPSDWQVRAGVAEVAAQHGCSAAQVALASLCRQPSVTAPIIGVRTAEQMEAMAAALDIKLDDEQYRALEQHYRPRSAGGGL